MLYFSILIPNQRPQLGNRVDSGLILPDSDLQALKPSALPTNVSNPGSTPEQKSEPVILSEDDDSVLPVPDIKIIVSRAPEDYGRLLMFN